MTGVLVLVGVLAAATVVGLWLKAREGRLEQVGSAPESKSDSSSDSNSHDVELTVADDSRPADVERPDRAHHGGEVLTADVLGGELGDRATLVQFSSAFCQPCRATKLVLSDIAKTVPGVTHVEVDAESHLDIVRHLDIRRTPTVFILDGTGAIRNRAVGLPKKSDVVAAVAGVV